MSRESTKTEVAKKLDTALAKSAFRRGISAFRYGLILEGVSDHLPISAIRTNADGKRTTLFSWNCLADQHLYNNFMNISGTDALAAAIAKVDPSGASYCSGGRNRLYHFFAELSQFLYQHTTDKLLTVTDELLDAFTSLDAQPSLIARSRDTEKAAKLAVEVTKSRETIVSLLKDTAHSNAHEFRLAIRHSMELIHHIRHDTGALQWKNRFVRLKNNVALVKHILSQDILCFQECTNPKDIQSLFDEHDTPITMLTHRINKKTNDHCILAFNPEKFTLIGEPQPYNCAGNKPCLFAKLKDKETGEAMMIGSVHLPGGTHCHLPDILSEINTDLPYYILGDHNNTDAFYRKEKPEEDTYETCFPDNLGTMAGSDFGNNNQAIDAITTNTPESLSVSVCTHLPAYPMADTPLSIRFKSRDVIVADAGARFFKPVIKPEAPEKPILDKPIDALFSASTPTLGSRVTLGS